jgi:hypothetical protein
LRRFEFPLKEHPSPTSDQASLLWRSLRHLTDAFSSFQLCSNGHYFEQGEQAAAPGLKETNLSHEPTHAQYIPRIRAMLNHAKTGDDWQMKGRQEVICSLFHLSFLRQARPGRIN